MPITRLRSSNLLKRFSRTSLLSSLNSAKNKGKICSLVADFSIIGQTERMFSAKALLTYWKVSV